MTVPCCLEVFHLSCYLFKLLSSLHEAMTLCRGKLIVSSVASTPRDFNGEKIIHSTPFRSDRSWTVWLFQKFYFLCSVVSFRLQIRFSKVPKCSRTQKAITKSRSLWLRSCVIHTDMLNIRRGSLSVTNLWHILDTDLLKNAGLKMALRVPNGLSRNGPPRPDLRTSGCFKTCYAAW